MKKIDWLVLFLITAISVILLKDLLKPGMYTSHDGWHQVARFYYFDQSLRDGQLPPRWAGGLMNGAGYPLFIFSYHLPWFIAEIIRTLGFSIIESVKYTFLAGFILSGIIMYLVQKSIFNRFAAIVGSAIYLLAPYRFSNIFVRASIGDATAFIFAPLVFWSLWKLKEKIVWQWIVLGSIGIAGLILSHAMVAALFLAIFVLYFLISNLWVKDKLSYLKSFLLVFISGFGISAYYVIPSILERGNTKFTELMNQIFTGAYFPAITDLIYTKWGYGVFHAKEGAMSLQLGIAQWLTVLLTAITVVFYLRKKKKRKKDVRSAKEGIILLTLVIVTIFLMLSISLPVWKTVSQYVFIDFPWRMLSVSVFLISLCAGLLIFLLGKYNAILGVFLILLALYFNRNHLHINEILPWDLSFILKLEKTTNSFDEYTPKWVINEYITENKPRVEFLAGKAGIEILKTKSNSLEFSLDSPQSGIVRVNTIYYPGWKVWVDGKEEKIDYPNGLIEFEVGEGKKNVVARFGETPLRLVSNIISLASIGILLFCFIKYKKTWKKYL